VNSDCRSPMHVLVTGFCNLVFAAARFSPPCLHGQRWGPWTNVKRSARQQHHHFDVVRLGEEIEKVCLLDAIPARDQGGEVPGQRGWIA